MNLLKEIELQLDPTLFRIPLYIWNSLIFNSRIRFHSFFRHAENLKAEENLALKEYTLSKRHFKEFLSIIYKYWRLNFYFNKRKNELSTKLAHQDLIVLKSFSYKSSLVNGQFRDPFFQSFTSRLAEEKNHLIIIDPLMSYHDTKQLLTLENMHIIPWFVFISNFDFLKAFFLQIFYFFSLRAIPSRNQNSEKNSWIKEINQELLHPTTFHHLLFYFAFQRITRRFTIKRFILTFENNSWEKVVMQTFRENSPSTFIVGYQHSVVPESALGMRFLPWEQRLNNLPDIIYTTGNETQNILKSFNLHSKIPIEALCALRYDYLFNMKNKMGPLNKNILVALEAIVESTKLINIILELKDYFLLHDYKVTFRFHPAMSYNFFKDKIDAKKLETFAKISQISLEADLEHHDCVIYWGSTVALESSFIGNALINFQSNFLYSHDPLYRCQHLKFIMKNVDELKVAIESIYSLDLPDINQKRKEARAYIENYFHRPTAEHLNTLLGVLS